MANAQYVWSGAGYVDELVLRDRDANGLTGDGLEERFYVAQDANYNVTAIFGIAGGVQERYVYDPYGAPTIYDATYANVLGSSAFAWAHLHQGLVWDAVTGKYHARHRDYDPVQGRWTSNDPLGFGGGDTNWHRALGSNPGSIHDPLGLAGDGHHWVPVAVVMDDEVFPFLSKKALYVQAGSVSGPTIDSEGKGHMFRTYGGVKHSDYNDIVKKESNRSPHWDEFRPRLAGAIGGD